ncbi:unnamed protein product [Ophioblennius macclurei]
MNTRATMENLSLTTNLSECILIQHTLGIKPFGFFLVAIIIIAIPSNSFSLYVSWQHIRQKNELGVFLFSLALSDLTFSLNLILWVDFLWQGTWMHGMHLCIFSVYATYTNFYMSEALLCCIALNRYLAVVHPLKCVNLRTVGTATAVSTAMWVTALCFSAVTMRWLDSEYEVTIFSVCFDNILQFSDNQICGSVIRFIGGFVAPVALVSFTTWEICMAVNANQATEERERKRISKLLALVLVSLLICFGPLHIMALTRAFVADCRRFQKFLHLYNTSIAISCLNCLADPLLYCFVTKTGQANVNHIILFLQGKKNNKDESDMTQVQHKESY